MKPTKNLCLFLVLTLTAFAASAWAQASTASKPKKAKATITAADVQALKDAIASQQAAIASQQAAIAQQQQEIHELRDELHGKEQSVQQAQSAATAAQAQANQQQQVVGELKTDVADLKANVTNTALSIQETQKNVSAAIENPLVIHYKGINITPGGFLAADFVRRNRALAADINTPFNSLTLPGASQSAISEFFGSGRASRISMLVEGKLKNATLSGYYEADFLSAGVTSNSNQSNSYTLRQRQAWGQAALNTGWTITGGQMWSLVTETKHGADNRTEAPPLTIDPAYNVGFSFARQYGLRLAKKVSDKLWLAVSMENAQATVTTHGNETNFLVGSAGANGGAYNGAVTTCTASNVTNPISGAVTLVTVCTPAAPYSFNPSPDIIAKAVFEPGFGHYEVFGIYDRFRDRTFPCAGFLVGESCNGVTVTSSNQGAGAFNVSKNGGGIGANARWTVHQHFDVGLHGLFGKGIGRYGTSALPDSSIRADGSFALIKNAQGLGTLEWHGPKLDVYLNAGVEYAGRAWSYDPNLAAYVGYGSPFASNAGCYTETGPTANNGFAPGSLSKCTGDTRATIEGTVGYWYRFYSGPKGRLQFGTQFSYVTRQTWSGVGPLGSGMPGVSPEGVDGMVLTSLRYYLP
jgi:hypothetical protein